MHTKRQAMIVEWLTDVADKLRASFKQDIEVAEKTSRHDLVTEMDRWAESYLVDKIRQYYPDDQIIGEEGCGDDVTSTDGTIWVIDPIDGTLNFVKSQNYFAIMVGIFEDGEPIEGYIYDVMPDDLYVGIVGEGAYCNGRPFRQPADHSLHDSLMIGNVTHFIDNRMNMQALAEASIGICSIGSAALQSLSVFKGEVALYFSIGLEPWDLAAPVAIATSLGLKATDHTGAPLSILKRQAVLIATPQAHQEALTIIKQTNH
ncbi:inositol monophosphatase family protein [Aerococcaceae bacterium DSM 111020]|nr:inositol monophosphatase family protein [Aerococcaceae bacterium DSM 111020]